MRTISSLVFMGLCLFGVWWLWNNNSQFRETIETYIENGQFTTLEARLTPEQIMERHQSDLLADSSHTYQTPTLKFHPYLFMQVKYPLNNRLTREGVILWSMVDGEMILNTQTWEKTHGFEDAINSGAARSDFILINILSKSGGALERNRLQNALNQESDKIENWIERAKSKHLIIDYGDELRLHFQNPKFTITPETRINHSLVTKTYNNATRVSQKYTQRQIENTAQASFGDDFAVRKSKVVYLPVYQIEVLNPDGSVHTSFWNALNGQRLDTTFSYF